MKISINEKDFLVFVQAKNKKDILQILLDENDENGIVKKKNCYELIIKQSRVNNTNLSNCSIHKFFHNSRSINFYGLISQSSGYEQFNLSDYVEKNYGYKGRHLKDTMVYYFNRKYEEKYHESLEPEFFISRLFTTTIKQLLFEYHEISYYDEFYFCSRSSFNISLDLIGWWIGERRLKIFQSLSYEIAKMMFHNNV